MSLCMLVRTLKKSASRFSIARAEVTDSTAGSDSSHERRIVRSGDRVESSLTRLAMTSLTVGLGTAGRDEM
jgi:hypothetical protein